LLIKLKLFDSFIYFLNILVHIFGRSSFLSI
jgi:hypothetical protein